MGILGTMLGGAIQGIGQIFGNKSKKREAEKQHERQKELMDKSQGQSKEMYDYTQAGSKEMYDYQLSQTNAKAQMHQMKEAGLNPALMYGQGGAGGTGTASMGTGSSSGQSAPSASKADVQAITSPMDMGQLMLLKAQKENIEANTEKTKVDTAKTAGVDTDKAKADTEAQQFANEVNKLVGSGAEANNRSAQYEVQQLVAERMNADWEGTKAVGYGGKTYDNPDALANKVMKAGYMKTIEEVKAIEASIGKTDAETARTKIQTVIDQYKADLAKEGINPDAPAIEKGIIDALRLMGSPEEFKDKVNETVKKVVGGK